MEKFKILLITPDFPPNIRGGCGISCNLLVEELRNRGIETDVFAFTGNTIYEETNNGYTRHFNKVPTPLGLNFITLKELRKINKKYDIIHIYDVWQIPAATIYAHSRNIGVVATLNNMDPICANPAMASEHKCISCNPLKLLICSFQREDSLILKLYMPFYWIQLLLFKRFVNMVDSYIAISNSMKNIYINAKFPREKITVIPNMFDPITVEDGLKCKNKIKSNGKKKIIYVGRLDKEKGVDILINAFHQLNRKDVILYIVGKGTDEMALKEMCNNLGIEKNVFFIGFVDPKKIAKYYEDSDIFVHPALWPEAFGRTILEALSFQIPLIVSDIGAPPEIIGNAGLTFERGNSTDLKEKIARILDDDDLREYLRSNAHNRLSQYTPDTVVSRTLDVYKDVMYRKKSDVRG